MSGFRELATYRNYVERASSRWSEFQNLRRNHLAQQARFDKVPEKVAENIVRDLFTTVLDWSERDLNWQLERADLVVTQNFVKFLVVETKSPGSLTSLKSLDSALDQAWRYACEQKVKQVAVSDGIVFYGADLIDGGLKPRVYFDMTQQKAPHESLWWISVAGIYRPCETPPDFSKFANDKADSGKAASSTDDSLLHPKYGIPARCFAYVGNPNKTSTWKLPYLLEDGTADLKRLPKAAQALASNYRGVKVGGIPDEAIPDVFRRLGKAAENAGKMPAPGVAVAPIYQQLAEILDQLAAAGK